MAQENPGRGCRRLQGELPALLADSLLAAMPAAQVRPVLVNGAAGAVITVQGRPVSLMACTVTGGRGATSDGTTYTPRPPPLHPPSPSASSTSPPTVASPSPAKREPPLYHRAGHTSNQADGCWPAGDRPRGDPVRRDRPREPGCGAARI